MGHIVHCRSCGEAFDRDKLEEGKDWVKPSNNMYYHKQCFDNWVRKQGDLNATMSDEGWYEALSYYLHHIIKAPIDWRKLKSQWNNFLRQRKNAKGIYFAMRYYYDVTNGDKEKSQGGIGIVSMIYQDSCEYWHYKADHDYDIIQKIEEQAREQATKKIINLPQTKRISKKRKPISLDEI